MKGLREGASVHRLCSLGASTAAPGGAVRVFSERTLPPHWGVAPSCTPRA
ncbi:hypothetical protein RR11_851 [Ruegeria sp. R11]|nr:hypothetical protein RR11_851 [Ruegeria sp. R11]